jgi:hypothetical protein
MVQASLTSSEVKTMNLKALVPQITVRNPLTLALERMGLIEPKLIAWNSFEFMWPETDDEGVTQFYPETSSIYLVEFPSGRRDYRVYEYGISGTKDAHEVHMAPVMAWIYGGTLPMGYKLAQQPEIIKLRVVTPQKA